MSNSNIIMDSSNVSNRTIDEVLSTLPTLSSKIRYLHSRNFTRSQIVIVLSTPTKKVLYQHVRNVLITPLKKS